MDLFCTNKKINTNLSSNDICKNLDTLLLVRNIHFLCNNPIEVNANKISISSLEKKAGVSAGYISRIENAAKNSNTSTKTWTPSANFILAISEELKIYIDLLVNIDLSILSKTEYEIVRFMTSIAKSTYDNKLEWNMVDLPSVSKNEINEFDLNGITCRKCTASIPNSSLSISVEKEENSNKYSVFLTTPDSQKNVLYTPNTASHSVNYAYSILIRSISIYFRTSFILPKYKKSIKIFLDSYESTSNKLTHIIAGDKSNIMESNKIKQITNTDDFITPFHKKTFFSNLSVFIERSNYAKSQVEQMLGVSQGFISRINKNTNYSGDPNFNIVIRASQLFNKDIYYLNYVNQLCLPDSEQLLYDFVHKLYKKTRLDHQLWNKNTVSSNLEIYETTLSKSKVDVIIKYHQSSGMQEIYIKQRLSKDFQPIAIVFFESPDTLTYFSKALMLLQQSIEVKLKNIPDVTEIDLTLLANGEHTINDIISSLW